MARRATPEQLTLGRRKASRRQQCALDNALLEASRHSREARSTLRAMLASRKLPYVWDGVRFLPPGSVLETVCAAFQGGTDIPLELPLFTTLSMVSAHLLQHGVTIDLCGQEVSPALWSIMLAPSGAGKTFTVQQIMKMSGATLQEIPDSASAAMWIETLAKHNGGILIRDEVGQYLKAIEEQPHMAEVKGYLLQTYDGQRLSRRTKQGEIVIGQPRMVFVGYTVDKTWSSCVSPEAMLDGFAQRFNFVVARRRPGEPRPLYDLSAWRQRVHNQWRALEAVPLHPCYTVSAPAVAAFEEAFRTLNRSIGDRLPASYIRRALFSAIRYALVYHVVLGKSAAQIDAIDMGWAARLVEKHLADGTLLLDDYGASEVEKKAQKVETLLEACRAGGNCLTPREVVRRVAGIANVNEARALLQLVLENDDVATDEEMRIAAGGRRERAPEPKLRLVRNVA